MIQVAFLEINSTGILFNFDWKNPVVIPIRQDGNLPKMSS